MSKQTLHLTINFRGKEEYSQRIDSPLYIPNLNEYVNNPQEPGIYSTVTNKEVYYSEYTVHVIITVVSNLLLSSNDFTKQTPIE